MPDYRGLTWDHPRGRNALEASSPHHVANSDSWARITWDAHPLSGFESRSIREITRDYDLVVLDHPHLGDALAGDSLRPLDTIFSEAELAEWGLASVGPSMDSYRLGGHVWALPIDAATQVAVRLTYEIERLPQTWADVEQLSKTHPVALCLAGPHAIVTFASACVAYGEEPAVGDDFVSVETATAVFDVLAALAGRAPAGSADLDPIDLLLRMTSVGDVHYVPLVFGYVTFAAEQGLHRLSFGNAPSATEGGRRGSTLGGAGIAISSRCAVSPELVDYLRWLMSADTQERFIPLHEGQPSARRAWQSSGLNESQHYFYASTLATIENAWVRPRYEGYIGFQTGASAIVRSVLNGDISTARGVADLNTLHRGSRGAVSKGAVS